MFVRPFFFNYLVYGSADPIFQDLEKKKKIFFFFFYKFSVHVCRRPALNPLANKLWSPAHNELREELEPTDPVQGYDTISK